MSSTRLLVHFADAPCHGTTYHTLDDDYPDGDPNGLNPIKLLEKLCLFRVDYYFAQINKTTEQMTNILAI